MKTKILLVDDEKVILLSLRKEIIKILGEDVEIDMAENGHEAIPSMEEKSKQESEYQYGISNFNMPGINNGIDVLEYARGIMPKAYRVLNTGFIDEVIIPNGIAMGIIEKILKKKPLKLEKLKAIFTKETI